MREQSISYFIVIAGCGRVGAYLANTLSHNNHSVVIIDQNDEAFSLLAPDFSGFKVEGDAIELNVLKQSKAQKADILLAVSNDENTNIMVAQIAKTLFQIPHVAARVFDLEKGLIFQEDGIQIICPTSIIGDAFLNDLLSPGGTQL